MPLTLRRMLFLPLVSALLASPALGDPPASAPSTMPAALPLAAMKPEPVRQMSRHEFDALFAPFHHVPFNNAGFNALALPFHFASPDHTGDPAEANAFSFLLSDNLDWSPGSYNTRHAYFVFDRDKAGMLDLQKKLRPHLHPRRHQALERHECRGRNPQALRQGILRDSQNF